MLIAGTGIAMALFAQSSIGKSLLKVAFNKSIRSKLVLDRFGALELEGPYGRPSHFILALIDRGNQEDFLSIKSQLISEGAIVGTMTTEDYVERLKSEAGDECTEIGGEFERLNQVTQKNAGFESLLPSYLIGMGDNGSALAPVVAGQASRTFSKVATFNGCPTIKFPLHWCDAPGLQSDAKGSIALTPPSQAKVAQGEVEGRVCETPSLKVTSQSALVTFLSEGNFESTSDEWKLPVIHITPENLSLNQAKWPPVIFLSGDGGWATIDQMVGAELARRGQSVIGFDSLEYFWTRRTATEGSAMLRSLITQDGEQERDVIVAGFSFGADVLPSLVVNLDDNTRRRIKAIILLSPGMHISWEIELSDWLPGDTTNEGEPILPVLQKITNIPMLCAYGSEEEDISICPRLEGSELQKSGNLEILRVEGDHHFNGDYVMLGDHLSDFLAIQLSQKHPKN